MTKLGNTASCVSSKQDCTYVLVKLTVSKGSMTNTGMSSAGRISASDRVKQLLCLAVAIATPCFAAEN